MGEAQEAEDEGASPRPRRYPRSRYRPDGTRRRTAGELRARGARNQWPPSTSQNKRGADNRPRGQQARDRTQSLQPRAQANQWKHRGPRQDEHRDYGLGEIEELRALVLGGRDCAGQAFTLVEEVRANHAMSWSFGVHCRYELLVVEGIVKHEVAVVSR